MLAYTIKLVVDVLHKNCGAKEFCLEAYDPKEKLLLLFKINRDKIDLLTKGQDLEWIEAVDDIEMLKLPEEVKIQKLIEISPDTGETSIMEVKFEAQLFIKVFRVMKDRVCFTINSSLGMKYCYYLNRKMYYIDETEDKYSVVETNLYKFHKTNGDYGITTFSPIIGKMDNNIFVNDHQQIAQDLSKEFCVVRL